VSWDEALDAIAARLQETSDRYGPESILPYSYAGTIGVLGYGSMDRRFFIAWAPASSTARFVLRRAGRRGTWCTAKNSVCPRRISGWRS
jgi:anaerobic selenocysteine-containing dehydrogenase